MAVDTPVIERSELITASPAEALAGLLDVACPDLSIDGELPLLWHWLYLLDRPVRATQGADGHPLSATVPLPPGPGYRRMFAGGRISMSAPLRIGFDAHRRSQVISTQEKNGRSGPLTFVTARHEITQGGRVVITDEQDIVYRRFDATTSNDDQPSGHDTSTSTDVPSGWRVPLDPVLLFRFSALTYNGHRIHYDREYATGVEGHPGLVVHGPLQALVMTEAARRAGLTSIGPIHFEFRLQAPLFDGQCLIGQADAGTGGTVATAIVDGRGRRTAIGKISEAPAATR